MGKGIDIFIDEFLCDCLGINDGYSDTFSNWNTNFYQESTQYIYESDWGYRRKELNRLWEAKEV